jgi:hypothetical protein
MNIFIERSHLRKPISSKHMRAWTTFIFLPLSRALPRILIPWTFALPSGYSSGIGIISTNFDLIASVIALNLRYDVIVSIA